VRSLGWSVGVENFDFEYGELDGVPGSLDALVRRGLAASMSFEGRDLRGWLVGLDLVDLTRSMALVAFSSDLSGTDLDGVMEFSSQV
jgi:hypothetical protein